MYRHSPGAQSLLTVFGAEHSLGGSHAYGTKDTTDESPERVALSGSNGCHQPRKGES
ncbi:hypothetical protein [Streptomyces violaceusniger]|uniref:hypothetical protein n=1 Tax=Streptomyces violaceusniger TaxID=68280 RepID=UPI003F54989D